MEEIQADPELQRLFYGLVREFIIVLLLCSCVYFLSYLIVNYFKGSIDQTHPIIKSEEDGTSSKITTILCSVAVAVSLGATVLLPCSIISNEIRHLFPRAYYVDWLNTSLITDLWNIIFLGSNLCLFLLLPFAYFFYEAEGLPGTKRGVMSKVYEAIIVLVLVGLLVFGIVWVADSITGGTAVDTTDSVMDVNNLLSCFSFLYSCTSMMGVLLTSLCTPIGFAHVFTILGKVIVQPELHIDVPQELESLQMELVATKRKSAQSSFNGLANGTRPNTTGHHAHEFESVESITEEIKRLERHRTSSRWERQLFFPLSFFFLLSLTLVSLLFVSVNIFNLIVSSNYLSKETQDHVHVYDLGEISSSFMGPLGTLVEVVLITYMIAASLIGFYTTPFIKRVLPIPHNTSMLKMILNSIILLILSSAMPVMVRALGITSFNLMGHFSSIGLLQNFWPVICYNVTFFLLTCIIISKKATHRIISEVTLLTRTRVRSISIGTSLTNFKRKLHDE